MNDKYLIALCCLLLMPAAQALSLNGFTQFAMYYDLNARVAGVIQKVNVRPGQRIKKGDTLLEMDATIQRAELEQAQALEASLKPETEIAELELEKALELYDRDSLSQVALKNAENKLAKIEGKYRRAQAATAIAKYRLRNTRLVSPVNGRVLKLHRAEAQYVNPGVDSNPIITLVSSQNMIAVGLISSDQWRSSLIGRSATVQFRERKFNGIVSALGYQRVRKSSGVASYEIHVSFKTDQLIPEQMPVMIEIPE